MACYQIIDQALKLIGYFDLLYFKYFLKSFLEWILTDFNRTYLINILLQRSSLR